MRNRYLDLLRAVAIVRVVVYHSTESAWMSIALSPGALWFSTHPDPVKGYHLGDITIGDAL